jgi:hypothetical protein
MTQPITSDQPIGRGSRGTGKRGRLALVVVSLAAFALCGGSIALMMQRIIAFHEASPRHFFRFQQLSERQFTYAGRPVTVADDPPTGQAEAVVVTYGDETLRLRRTIPTGRDGMPGLIEHMDWLRIMRFADASGMTDEQFVQRLGTPELPDRLVVVTRSTRPGANPESWGKVWKRDWVFDFYEFKTEGGFEYQRLRYPTATRMKEPKPGELHENTWQFQAAMHLMPQAGNAGPTRNFRQDALAAVGWTLPLSMFAGLVGVVALFFAAAPARRSV